jgi:glycosyltransferase involved in cell wall biosynthesis
MKDNATRPEGAPGDAAGRKDGAGGRQRVSLVVPVRNEEQSLPRLLETIARQTFRPAEIILVDGGSTDDTVGLARRAAETDARIRVIEAGPATPGRGRNVGIEAVSHEWVALTDAGNRLEPTCLGIPTVCSPVGVNSDIIRDGVSGLLASSADEWFEKLAGLLRSPDQREQLGREGRATVEAHYSASVQAPRVFDIIKSVIETKSRESASSG